MFIDSLSALSALPLWVKAWHHVQKFIVHHCGGIGFGMAIGYFLLQVDWAVTAHLTGIGGYFVAYRYFQER
jgi:hypothetical protein